MQQNKNVAKMPKVPPTPSKFDKHLKYSRETRNELQVCKPTPKASLHQS